jgi:hypothetical protein
MDENHPDIVAEIESKRELSQELMQGIDAAIYACKSNFIRDNTL